MALPLRAVRRLSRGSLTDHPREQSSLAMVEHINFATAPTFSVRASHPVAQRSAQRSGRASQTTQRVAQRRKLSTGRARSTAANEAHG
eukprot:3277732-Pleurochrysis_carterae.AAC.2